MLPTYGKCSLRYYMNELESFLVHESATAYSKNVMPVLTF